MAIYNFIVTFATSDEDKVIFKHTVSMKYRELYKELRKAGCLLLRHGCRHDIWQNPANGQCSAVPRHGTEEVPKGTLKSIYQRLGL